MVYGLFVPFLDRKDSHGCQYLWNSLLYLIFCSVIVRCSYCHTWEKLFMTYVTMGMLAL